MMFPLRHTGLSFRTSHGIIHIHPAVKRISILINELQLKESLNKGTPASQVPMGLPAHQMGVFVGVDVKLLIETDSPVIHGVDVLGGLG
jgi:hypothetical protein